jgi:hypothetical protein
MVLVNGYAPKKGVLTGAEAVTVVANAHPAQLQALE